MPTRQKTKQAKQAAAYNGWECLRDFFGHVFGLINTGQIFPALGILIVMLIGMVMFKVPNDQMPGVITQFLDMLGSSVGIAYGLLGLTNVVWVVHYKTQRRLYLTEIKRLAAIRKELMHGYASSVPIKEHRSSTGQQSEGYLVPADMAPADPKESES